MGSRGRFGASVFDEAERSSLRGSADRPLVPPQPVNSFLRPTTLYFIEDSPGLTFSHELVFDVFFQRPGSGPDADDRLMIATMYKRDVTVARSVVPFLIRLPIIASADSPNTYPFHSSVCKLEALTLPAYSESTTE